MGSLADEKQAGYFLFETVLISVLLLAMTAAAGMYVKAAQLRGDTVAQSEAAFLAREQMAYVQALLDQEGTLPEQLDYLGDRGDLQQNNVRYEVRAEAQAEDGLWQLTVMVSWEAGDVHGRQEYRRKLARHG